MAFYLGPWLVQEQEVDREEWLFNKLSYMRETSNPEELRALPEDFDLPPEEVQHGSAQWVVSTSIVADDFYINTITDNEGFYLTPVPDVGGFYITGVIDEEGFYLTPVPDIGGFYITGVTDDEGFYIISMPEPDEIGGSNEFYINTVTDNEGFYLTIPYTLGGFYILTIKD